MSTVRKTISMSEKVHEAAKRQMAEYGYGEFSDYIQALIRADTGVQPGGATGLRAASEYKAVEEISSERKVELDAETLKFVKGLVSKKKKKKASKP